MSALTLRLLAALLLLVALAIVLDELLGLVGVIIPLALAVVLAPLLAAYLSRGLRETASAARTLGEGNYSTRLHLEDNRELNDAFNTMASQVQQRLANASQERGRLAAVLNSSMDAVVALDRSGRVLFANLAAESLLGEEASPVQGSQVAWLLPDEDVVEAVRASRDRATESINRIERPGHRFFQVVTTPIVDGGDWSVLVVLHDVTDVQRTEQMRRDFVANVSHELRTPLAGIKAVIETLAEGAINDDAVAGDFLNRADAEVDRLIQLVEELLELSRIESGQLPLTRKNTEVDVLIREAVARLESQAERKQLSLSVEVQPNIGLVSLDQVRMEHALTNLVHNAIKFTPDGGSIDVRAWREGDALHISVTDNGYGIEPGDIPRIFERFYKADQSRTSGGGSGIGLAIVKHTVEAHGGTVSVRSERGKGSQFTIILPCGPASALSA